MKTNEELRIKTDRFHHLEGQIREGPHDTHDPLDAMQTLNPKKEQRPHKPLFSMQTKPPWHY